MSMLEPEDIAQWEAKKMKNKTFQVEEIEAISFDENGKETGTWKGFSVSKIDDPANYCFDCRDKINADKLCDFLNNNCYININDFSIEAEAMDNCIEWTSLINDLSDKEIQFYKLKEKYQESSEQIISETDFKALYGKNNESIRKQHVKKELSDEHAKIKNLEFEIDYLKRRISYLKALVYLKTSMAGVENE